VGCVVALAGLSWWGGVGVIIFAALVAMLAALGFQLAFDRRSIGFPALTVGAIVLFAVWVVQPPDWFELRLSPYKDLSAALRYPGAQIISTQWNAASRVDHVQSEGIRSLPGLSFTFRGSPPKQDGLTFDGDDLTPIPLIAQEQATFAPYLLMSLPFQLRPGGDALVLEPRGGLDVFLARVNGAQSITAVEPNELALAAASAAYADPHLRVVVDEPRAYAERAADQFDVIDLALTAPYRPVTSGAYSLAEDYRLTVEAFEQYLARLKPDGIFTALRWLQTPPSEETRLIALAAEAVRKSGADPSRSIVALRGYSTVLLLVKRGQFTPANCRRSAHLPTPAVSISSPRPICDPVRAIATTSCPWITTLVWPNRYSLIRRVSMTPTRSISRRPPTIIPSSRTSSNGRKRRKCSPRSA